jgi:hypothetical protein
VPQHEEEALVEQIRLLLQAVRNAASDVAIFFGHPTLQNRVADPQPDKAAGA